MPFRPSRFTRWCRPVLAALLWPGAVLAQSVQPASVPCHQSAVAGAQNIWFPVEDGIRLYANGNVRFIWLDTEEPACCSSHLMVAMPDPDMPGQICTVFSMPGGEGFRGIDLQGAEAKYDPAHGLLVGTAVNIWQGDGAGLAFLMVLINQGQGTIEARLVDP